MLTAVAVVALYAALVALAAARNEIVDLRARPEPGVAVAGPAPAPLPDWATEDLGAITWRRPGVVARNDFAHLIPLAGPEWRDGPTNAVSWPVAVRPDGTDFILTSVARGYDDYTHGRVTKQMAAI